MIKVDPEINDIAATYWRDWARDTNRSEATLNHYVYAVVNMLGELSYNGDTEAIARLWDLYRYGEHVCHAEPYRSVYELGLIHFTLVFAENHHIEGDFEEALDDVEVVVRRLVRIERRRARRGEPNRPYSSIRLTALMVLAACKMDGPPELLDRVMTPEQVVRSFWRVTNRMFKRMDELDVAPRMREDAMILLASAELEVCKLALKHVPELVSKAVRFFNTHHGTHLTLRPNHFKRRSAIIANAWYWEFELFKVLLSDKPDPADIRHLDGMRRKTARLAFTGCTVLSHYKVWDRQLKWAEARRANLTPA